MEELMNSLWSCLPNAVDEALTGVHRILQYLDSGLTSEERDVLFHIMFEEDNNIHSFLNTAVREGMKKISSEVLRILAYLLNSYSASLENYINVIKAISMSFITNPTSSADEKDKAFDVLIAIVKSGPWTVDLSYSEVVKQLLRMASRNASKPTVLRKVYCLVGVMAEQLPHIVNPKSENLMNAMLEDLDHQISTSAKVEFTIIEGCFEGLSGFLTSFPLNGSANTGRSERLASYIMKVLTASLQQHRKTAARAALNVLARHGDQLDDFLVCNYEEWHKVLRSWLNIGKDERYVAKQALLTFYQSVSKSILDNRNPKETLTIFYTHFKTQFEKLEDVDIAIKGLGLFAKAMKLHTPEDIPVIFNVLAQRSHEDAAKGNHHKIADYLDSLSVLTAESGMIHNLQLSILEGLSVQLICQFAQEEHPSWQTVMVNAVIATLLRLGRCDGSALDMYITTVVHQGIIRTVSHPVLEDAKLLREASQKNVLTYESYLPFWQSLITMNNVTRDLDEQRNISRRLINKILESIIDIIDRLDLTLKTNISSEPIYHSDIEKVIEASSPQDYTVLVNLVDFAVTLLNSLPDQSHLMTWISPLIMRNIHLSTRHPLVSSFYKLLANTVLIAQKLGYFDEQKDEMEDVDWRPTMNLLSGFLHDVIARQSQYRGDLQVSCLRLMLALPSCIATPLLRECAPAFQSVFRLGCSMISLAQEGLQTLSCWNQDIPREKMSLLLQAVLPSFDSLLQTKDRVANEEEEKDSSLSGMAIVKKVLQDQKKKKLWTHKVNSHIDTELVQLQKDVILFLSTLDSATCLSLLEGSEDRVELTAWQEGKLLMFPLPFQDMKVKLGLDDLLPRLTELATSCGDRQTRSASCELLHAVILFMLGEERQLALTQQGHLTDLWKHLFPKILKLACDVDLIVSQLFEPLGKQMAHWYSSRVHENSNQAGAFLIAVLDGITHETDAALRDYSASCLHEYIKWAHKQHHMKRKVEPVIKFMASLCQHPCPQKRMGAALMFNSMYSVLREDLQTIDEFWIELLYCLVNGLSMCSVTGEDAHAEEQLEKSLQHILRVLIEKKRNFNLDSNSRRVPVELPGGRLSHILKWLLQYCTALNASCRRNCRMLVDRLAPYTTGCRSTKDFILAVIEEDGIDEFIKVVEGNGLITDLPKSAPWNHFLAWVNSLLASLDCYMWLIEQSVPLNLLFMAENRRLMQALSSFLEGVVGSKISETPFWRPRAMENFSVAKCTTVVRLIEYLTAVLRKKEAASLDLFWSVNFWKVLTDCLLSPSYVGFDSTSKVLGDNLLTTVKEFLEAFDSYALDPVKQSLKDFLKEKILYLAPRVLERFSESVRSSRISTEDRDLVKGLKVLHAVFKEAQEWSNLGEEGLQLVFFSIVERIAASNQYAPADLSPIATEYAMSMLKLYFTSSSELGPVIARITDASVIHRRGLQGDLTHGEYFVSCFETILVERLLRQPKDTIEALEKLWSPDLSLQSLTILPSLLRCPFRQNSQTWYRLQELVTCIFSKWAKFVRWSHGDFNKETWLISLLTQISKLGINFWAMTNCETVSVWISKQLCDPSRSLPQKTNLLHCLPILCSNSEATCVQNCLQALREQHFPSSSSEFASGSEELTNFVAAFEALLHSLVVTGNQAILHIVIKMMSVDAKHACQYLLPVTLENFMKRLEKKNDCQVQCLMYVYSMFEKETLDVDCRKSILNDFLLQLIAHASSESRNQFSNLVIKKLVNTVKERTNANLDASRGRQKLLSQIGCWNLLKLIYNFSSKSVLEEKGSELVQAAFFQTDVEVKTGKELNTHLTKRALEAFQKPLHLPTMSEEARELHREYMCAIYNMLATLVCNLKNEASDVKFYNMLLFDEKSKKIWSLLTDERKKYLLPYCSTENLKTVEKAVFIRRRLTEKRLGSENRDVHKTLELLESQSLAGSLETDITRFDFTHSRLLSTPKRQEPSEERSVIFLENDILNLHECMPTVCTMVRNLADLGIPSLPANSGETVLPSWMDSLRRSLQDETNPRNSRIFILRVILNCEPHFSPYAIHWIESILNCMVQILLENFISYLLGDLIGLLAKWTLENPSTKVGRSQVNKLLQFVIENCVDPLVSPPRAVFKYHLELIKSILELWKDLIDPPHDLLLKMLNFHDKRVGINLTAVMLWYELCPWTVESKNSFISFLQNNLLDNIKEIFKASSATLGLCLKFLSQANNGQLLPEDENFTEKLERILQNIHLKQRDCDRFLTVLVGVHEHYCHIVDSFIPAILFYLDQTADERKAMCLSLLASRLGSVGENPYNVLKTHGLLSMMSDRNLGVQTKALEILVELAPSLLEADLHEIIDEIPTIIRFINGEARHLVYEIALISFDRYFFRNNGTLSELEMKIYEKSKALLLAGLVDTNLQLQNRCFSKWTEGERLPTHAAQRLSTMFSLMYSPQTEQHFLSYSVPLMLEGTTSTVDFQSTVFAHALDDCEFERHEVSGSWRHRNAGMNPMFVQTFSSQRSQSSSDSFSDSSNLLATQNSLIFEPTADLVDGSTYISSQSKVKNNSVRSSFMFSQDGGSFSAHGSLTSAKINFKQGQGFGSQRLRYERENESDMTPQESGSPFKLNRFWGKNSAVKFHRTANIRRSNRRNEMWKERAHRREAQVSISRKYRKGDFPDVQIKFEDLINPLKELSKRDTIIAKKVMVNIFVGVKRAVDSDVFANEAKSLLDNILTLSRFYEPSTIGLCLEIAYHCQIDLNPDEVHSAAVNSDLLSLGVLLLEKATVKSNDEKIWVHLAELYDGLNERDVAHSTLLHNVQLGEKSQAALEAHAEAQWEKAKLLYSEGLNETPYDSFFESCFECMAVLSQWGTINKVIREEVEENLNNLWDGEWLERKLLPRLLQSEITCLVQDNKDRNNFMSVLSDWLKDEAKGAALKTRFSDTLSILCMIKKNFPHSRYFGSISLSKFIDQWSELTPLFKKRREMILLNIQKSAEVMGFFSEGKILQGADDCHAFLKNLERVLPTLQDSLIMWEARTLYRIACLKCFPSDMEQEVLDTSVKIRLSLIEAALGQKNQNFAKKYITSLSDKINLCSASIKSRYSLAHCQERHLWAKKEQNAVQCLDNLLQVWKKLDSVVASDVKSTPELSVKAHRAESDLSYDLRQLLLQDPDTLLKIKNENRSNYDWLCTKLQLQPSTSSSDIITSLEGIGLASLINSKNDAKAHSESERIAEAHLQIALYCRKLLDENMDSPAAKVTLARPLVRSILSAMKCGSAQARQLFPLLLQLPAISSDLSKDFKEKSASVPVWMFLSWIPQILSMLDTAVDAVGPLLLNIAKKYPNAVLYPYKVSREMNLRDDIPIVKKLDDLLESSSIGSQLLRALSLLTHPSIILKDHVVKLHVLVSSPEVIWNDIERICNDMKEIIGISNCKSSPLIGNFFKSVQNVCRDTFEKLCGAIKEKSKLVAKEMLEKIIVELKSSEESDKKNIKPYSMLKDFSPWLANFSSSKINVDIEIPGQYTGDQKPTPERHVTISRFDDKVQVMTSIRKPVQLTIIGSDTKSHKFLVKYGEDLRQDERIQQLLGIMNGIWSQNRSCRESHLSVVVYKVIPMSSRLGMIAWVDQTCSLKELMLSPLSDENETDRILRLNSIRVEHRTWLFLKHGANTPLTQVYGHAHNQLSRQDSIKKFTELVAQAEPDILRRGLQLWSASAESFYWLRHSFIKSYATLCIAHWLLGVGDRHLNNCLVSKKNGQCIGIDFGHAFGSATQFLGVPELIPFRLTPHIVNTAQPHGTSGFIVETMVNALRALRADPELLLATMQVFIQEPSLDWLNNARKHSNRGEENPEWFPVLKIRQANRKLKGVNPVAIIREDLESKNKTEFYAGYCKTLNGSRRHSIRAQLPEEELTPRQQVNCLIDLATDPNVLVKTWGGWEPWM